MVWLGGNASGSGDGSGGVLIFYFCARTRTLRYNKCMDKSSFSVKLCDRSCLYNRMVSTKNKFFVISPSHPGHSLLCASVLIRFRSFLQVPLSLHLSLSFSFNC